MAARSQPPTHNLHPNSDVHHGTLGKEKQTKNHDTETNECRECRTIVTYRRASFALSWFLKAKPYPTGEVRPALASNGSTIGKSTGVAFSRPVERVDASHTNSKTVAKDALAWTNTPFVGVQLTSTEQYDYAGQRTLTSLDIVTLSVVYVGSIPPHSYRGDERVVEPRDKTPVNAQKRL